jgi:hypothetical protein
MHDMKAKILQQWRGNVSCKISRERLSISSCIVKFKKKSRSEGVIKFLKTGYKPNFINFFLKLCLLLNYAAVCRGDLKWEK